MTKNDFYKVETAIQFISANSNELKISPKDVWEKVSEDPIKKTVKIHHYDKTDTVFKKIVLSEAGLESLIKKSKKINNPFKEEVFNENNELGAWIEVANQGAIWLTNFRKQIGKKSWAANYLEIKKNIDEFSANLTYLLNGDGDKTGKIGAKSLIKIDVRTQKSLNSIYNQPVLLLDKEDHNLKEGVFKHISPLEKLAKQFYQDGVNQWDIEEDAYMVVGTLSDSMQILKIAHHLHNLEFKKAYEGTNLDTSVRESLPEKFWMQFVDIDSEKRKKLEKDAKIILVNHEANQLKSLSTQIKSAKILKL